MKEVVLVVITAVLLSTFAVTVAAPYKPQWAPLARDGRPDLFGLAEARQVREFIAGVNPFLPGHEVDKLAAEFLRVSRERGVEVNLLLAVAAAESHFRADAISRVGCIGIMQIKPSTAVMLGVDPDDLTNQAVNIDTGARYLRVLLDRYEDITLAVAAYNAGPSRVRTAVPQIRETRNYVARVAQHRTYYNAI